MKVPLSNLILFAGIVDFGNVCKVSKWRKQTTLKSQPRWAEDSFGNDNTEKNTPQIRPFVVPPPPPQNAIPRPIPDGPPKARPVVVTPKKKPPPQPDCISEREPTKVIVKYSKTGDFEGDVEKCDEEAFLVELPTKERERTNVVRTKASCLVDFANGKAVLRDDAKTFKVNVGGINYDTVGVPYANYLYRGQLKSKSNIGLIRLSDPIFLDRSAVRPGCDTSRQWWITIHAAKFSANHNYPKPPPK